jgi:CO/xanthine dehydrogenase FAD-binding subunit
VAVHPSDVAPALVALDATVVTDRRTIGIEDFFAVGPVRTTVLEKDEIVIEIRVPAPPEGSRSSFVKFAQRRSIDFPIVNCAALVTGSAGRAESSRICLNAVWVNPYRAVDAEKAVAGRPLNAESAAESAEAAVRAARPLEHNGYMVSIARAMVKRALLACGEGRG